MERDPVKIKGRPLGLQKALVHPLLGARTVLTNSPWAFVGLWLKRNKHKDAALYWDQAQAFFSASVGLPTQSAPLLLYYCFMNAAKALLSSRRVAFNPYHGVKPVKVAQNARKISLSNESVKIKNQGIVPSLAAYLQESEVTKTHTLQELFFNMPYIHRTYCLTYTSQREIFLPLKEGMFIFEKNTKNIFYSARLLDEALQPGLTRILPATITPDPIVGLPWIRSANSIQWSSYRKPSKLDIQKLIAFHHSLRTDVQYINGTQTLWYLRTRRKGTKQLSRFTPTLTLAAMHWLSEICRYRPVELAAFMEGQKNWLLNEFITMSPTQFLDEMAAEITGYQFMIPNVRTPT